MNMNKTGTRIQRILRLIGLLESNRYYSAGVLAEVLEVSKRTIFRDLLLLTTAGIPCYLDKNKRGYHIKPHYFLPPVNLTLEEALSTLLLAHSFSKSESNPFTHAAEAGAKIESALSPDIRKQCEPLLKGIEFLLTPKSSQNNGVLLYNKLLSAISRHRKLCLVYEDPLKGRPLKTEFSPYRLLCAHRNWYVVGFSELHQKVNFIKLSQIQKLDMLDKLYVLDKPFDLDSYLGLAWSLNPEGKVYEVELEFSCQVAGNVSDILWHKTQQIEWFKDGSIRFMAKVNGLEEISWWILGYGDQVRVIHPQTLATKIKRMANRTAQLYTENPPRRIKDIREGTRSAA